MKPQLILPIGLPASGKSTLAKSWLADDPDARIRVNYDDLRKGMFGEDWVFNRADENMMQAHARAIVTKAILAGLSVIVDNTNLSQRVRASWTQLGQQLGAEVVEKPLDTSVPVCVARDKERGQARVGRSVIEMMALRHGLLNLDDRLGSRPLAIVDIDGTVANGTKRLHHLEGRHAPSCTNKKETIWQNGRCGCGAIEGKKPDWKAYFAECATDTLIPKVARIVANLRADHAIVFLSGRPISSGATKVGILTEDWLDLHGIRADALLLKDRDTHMPAPEFKREMVALLGVEKVAYVLDDDSRCCKMFREVIPAEAVVLQVHAEGGMP